MILEADYQVTLKNGSIDFVTVKDMPSLKSCETWMKWKYPEAERIEFLASIETTNHLNQK